MKIGLRAHIVWPEVMSPNVRFSVAVKVKMINQTVMLVNRYTTDTIK
jgi:hypothetical protein